MNKLVEWFARNSVAANMLMFGIVLIGFLTIQHTPKQVLPNIEPEQIQISSSIKNAQPELVETQLCLPIEQALNNVPAIKASRTTVKSENCLILVELEFDKSPSLISQQIQQLLSQVPLPANASTPRVTPLNYDLMVTRVGLAGEVPQAQLLYYAEQVQQDLLELGLSKTVLRDAPELSIEIQLSQAALRHYQLSIAEVAKVLSEQSLTLAAGQLQANNQAASIAISGQYKSIQALKGLVIRHYPDGGRVYLQDIAHIEEGARQGSITSRVNAQAAITLSTYQDRQHDAQQIAQLVKDYIANKALPAELELVLLQDNAKFYTDRMSMLQRNGATGLLLVFLILWAFLRARVAFWVSAGIPMAFLGGFIVLYFSGASINMVSTFGLLLVLGIVTDDAVIVSENIHKHQEMGKTPLQGAIDGAQEMLLPVFIAVLTTAITFVPLAFLPGAEGRIAGQIPLIVIAVLAFSLIECFFVLPAHLSHGYKNRAVKTHAFGLAIKQKSQALYEQLLTRALQFRYVTLCFFIGLFLFCISLIYSGLLNINLKFQAETEVAVASVHFPEGSNPRLAQQALVALESSALTLKERLYQQHQSEQIEHIRSAYVKNSHSATVFMNLSSLHKRKLSGEEIMQLWREQLGPIPEASDIFFSASIGRSDPNRLEYILTSHHPDALKQAADELKLLLQKQAGIHHIRDSGVLSQRTIEIQLLPTAYQLGLDMDALAKQVNVAFAPISLPPIQQEKNWLSVELSLSEADRSSLWQLENMAILLANGESVPLHTVAQLQYQDSPHSIKRINGMRVITISALLDSEQQSLTAVKRQLQSFFDVLPQAHPHVSLSKHSQQLIEQELIDSLWLGFSIAILVMYVIMAMLFGSYWQPLLILTAVPFGFVGAILGHLLLNVELSYLSLAGMIAVSGIVINDEVIMVHYSSKKLKEGTSLYDAVSHAGQHRFLAVFLTSVTTFFGILPIMLEPSWETQFLTPLAVSIAFGVMFSTFVTLVFLPALHLVCDDIAKLFKRLLA